VSPKEIEYYYNLESQNFTAGPESDDFWIWLNTDGMVKYPAIKDLLAPFPFKDLMTIVSGISDHIEFARSGSSIYKSLSLRLKEQGYRWEDFRRILDFACGCGRLTRLLMKYADDHEIIGSDINQRHIDWMRQNLLFARFFKNESLPPTRFEARYFDLILCVSLLSHLNESHHLRWLDEFQRITRENGIIILTVHGVHSYNVCRERPDIRQRMGVSASQLDEAWLRMNEGRFYFIPQNNSYIDRESYGFTFISHAYIRNVWSTKFDVCEVMDGAIEDWQDAVVLRRKREV